MLNIPHPTANSSSPAAKVWNVVFILRDLKEEHFMRGENYFLAPCDAPIVMLFRDFGKRCDPVRRFFHAAPEVKYSAAAFRIEDEECERAAEKAASHLSGLLDGLAPHVDHDIPETGPFYLVAPMGIAEMRLVLTGGSEWAYFNAKDSTKGEEGNDRAKQLFDATRPFFEIAAGIHARRDTPLARQLLYSVKMFRAGAEAGVFGVEFLCKWSALEGLVCAEERGKGKLLGLRIPALYPASERPAIQSAVQELWNMRSGVAHEAEAFCDDLLGDGNPLMVHIETIERLFMGVLIFALTHIETANDVKALWKNHETYCLPDFVRETRPKDMGRAAILHINDKTPFGFTQLGRVADDLFAELAAVNRASAQNGTGA